ncbi:MAG: hypothetical protein AAF490_17190 [Chloroflexota bacterium]
MKQKSFRKQLLERQILYLNGRIQEWQAQLDSLSQTRFILFIGTILISGALLLWQGAVVWGISFIPLFIPFAIGVIRYNRILSTKTRWEQWRQIKQLHVARMQLDWTLLPEPSTPPDLKNHPYGLDLDLVGSRSLHQLINTAVTQEGSDRLQQWLLKPLTTIQDIKERQELVQALEKRPLFRNKLILKSQASLKSGEKYPGSRLLNWLNTQDNQLDLRPWIAGLWSLSIITAVLLFTQNQLPTPNLWFISLLIYGVLFIRVSNQYTQTIFQDATFLAEQLDTLNDVFQFIESSHFQHATNLTALCQPFHDSSHKPSEHIRRLQRVMIGVGLRQNPLMGLILNVIMPWDLLFAHLLRQRQIELKQKLPIWLDVWVELEALGSLANFAYLNPDFVSYPKIKHEPCFKAQNLAHPLIADDARVGNDFTVPQLGQVGIITGSNMAGKSSFLRAVGLNLVLAYAGSAVFTERLETSLFRVHSSIRVTDSLQDGFSFFYAEVQRLKSILEAYELENKRPLFFLIDEIFRGTNNRERLIGSQSFIEVLASGQAIGLVATHDLDLIKLADQYKTIQNYHFKDDVENGKMIFDYTLRDGPCPTTNALKIMALAGLPVNRSKA